ncbi:hypothetical protein ALC62_01859 [Cyphomyrmex costatus]|uniref:Uncharacterized protein n=1 Tax=Cyphomyrmex costatus TaxID=456900 RepID=A0A151INZ8_9HYME|nr:hypothetical protein ALC62_01859 [Cyphomyrmex costatus]
MKEEERQKWSMYIIWAPRSLARPLASLPRGSLRAFVCVAAYVWLRRDMATAREAKHINCRLTPQKQHDLIPQRICKRLSYTSKFHSKATPTA